MNDEVAQLKRQLEQRTQELQACEAHFRNVINRNADGILIVDKTGTVRFINPTAEALFDRSSIELVGEIFGFPLAPGGNTELDIVRKSGELIIAEMRVVETDWEGEPAYLASLRDITDRKRAEEERAQLIREQVARAEAESAKRRLAFLAEASALLANSLNYETTLASVARLAVPHLADWCVVDVIEEDQSIRRIAAAYADPDLSKIEMAWEKSHPYSSDSRALYGPARVLRTGLSELISEINTTTFSAMARDADHLKILHDLGIRSYMCVPLLARGRTVGAMTFVVSETARRYSNEDLSLAEDLARRSALAVDNARLYREAQDANRIKDEFLATVSHELRTPLTAMLGWARMLRSNKLDNDMAKRALETIERNAKSQAQIVEDLLDVSRIITGKLRLDVKPIELTPVLEAAIDSVRPAADAKGIKIETVLHPAVGQVSGDPDRLQQIIWNLLSNATRFTQSGGKIEVRLERVDGHAELTVTDNGKGINTEFLPHVFERFRQADSTITRKHGGLGLGLAIVRHLVELHGGTVNVASDGDGKGATFTVKIPLAAVHHDSVERHHKIQEVAASSTPQQVELIGLKVMVVDDEPDTRDLLFTVLDQCGAEVKTACSVSEALGLLDNWLPDVLVSDIGMPGEDGYDLIGKIRKRTPERGGRTMAVALTAYTRVEDRMRALSAGFQMYVPKPVEPEELAAVVQSLAGRARKENLN